MLIFWKAWRPKQNLALVRKVPPQSSADRQALSQIAELLTITDSELHYKLQL
ncbi:MAG TPA: hypothetical protein V6D35_16245 [Candidatus Sericytochromatia bacterium]